MQNRNAKVRGQNVVVHLPDYTPPDQRFDTLQLNTEDCDFIGVRYAASLNPNRDLRNQSLELQNAVSLQNPWRRGLHGNCIIGSLGYCFPRYLLLFFDR